MLEWVGCPRLRRIQDALRSRLLSYRKRGTIVCPVFRSSIFSCRHELQTYQSPVHHKAPVRFDLAVDPNGSELLITSGRAAVSVAVILEHSLRLRSRVSMQ